MALNTINIEFDPCEPTPISGYRVRYRRLGSGGAYRTAGPFFTSPIVFNDHLEVAGSSFEGFIQGDCGGMLGVSVPWVAEFTGSVVAPSSEAPSSSAPSSSGGGPTPLCEAPGCGRYQAVGESPGGASFTWTDCEGFEHTTVIAMSEAFEFCTCDDNPQYTTDNVTVSRIGFCDFTEFVGGVGATEGEACSSSTVLYIGPGHTVVEPGAEIFNDVPPLTGVGTCVVRDSGGTLWFVVGSVVTTATGNSC